MPDRNDWIKNLIHSMFEEFVEHLASSEEHRVLLLKAAKHYLLKGYVPDELRACRCSDQLSKNRHVPMTSEQKEALQSALRAMCGSP